MHNRIEEKVVQFIMGPAYMEEDVRTETNKTGFCGTHLAVMYGEQNRLGLALMLHTHMVQLNKALALIVKNKLPSPLFGKDNSGPLGKIHSQLSKINQTCYVCQKVEHTFSMYIGTFLHMWGKGGEDAKIIRNQKGYCLPHFTQLVEMAAKDLGRSKRDLFLEDIVKPQLAHMKEMEEDLDWFTLKFDHRFADEPWKNSKDALPRTLAMFGRKE